MSNLTELIAAIAILVAQTFLSKREQAVLSRRQELILINVRIFLKNLSQTT